MATALEDYRLVFIGPAEGQTAVGDYSQNFVGAVTPCFGEVAEHRTGGPGADSVADIRRHRKAVADLVASGPPGRVLVHAELSTAVLAPFWSIAGLKGVPVTATVHDAPQGVWMPARTALRRPVTSAHPQHPLPIAPSVAGGGGTGERPPDPLRADRGRASFHCRNVPAQLGHLHSAYRPSPAHDPARRGPAQGGGILRIGLPRQRIRADLADPASTCPTTSSSGSPAGARNRCRATEGVEIVGGVDGAEEDEFFDSVRAIIVPYGKRHFYAESFAASGVVAHATAYRTPVVATDYGPAGRTLAGYRDGGGPHKWSRSRHGRTGSR